MRSSQLPIQAAPVERTVTGASMSSDKVLNLLFGERLPLHLFQ
ncbi:hypothetical protein [Okeania sp. SIO1I7]|nr:hypothetical protein [Okeania sp. SIO1I7]